MDAKILRHQKVFAENRVHFTVMWVLALLSLLWTWPRYILAVLLTLDAVFAWIIRR